MKKVKCFKIKILSNRKVKTQLKVMHQRKKIFCKKKISIKRDNKRNKGIDQGQLLKDLLKGMKAMVYWFLELLFKDLSKKSFRITIQALGVLF